MIYILYEHTSTKQTNYDKSYEINSEMLKNTSAFGASGMVEKISDFEICSHVINCVSNCNNYFSTHFLFLPFFTFLGSVQFYTVIQIYALIKCHLIPC